MENTQITYNQDILKFIEDQQSGKSGIYPHWVAMGVMQQFNITYRDAREHVQEHIRQVIDSLK